MWFELFVGDIFDRFCVRKKWEDLSGKLGSSFNLAEATKRDAVRIYFSCCVVLGCIVWGLRSFQEVVMQAEALYDTLMKAKSGPSQSSKPVSANWASAGWNRGADSGSTGVLFAVWCLC